MTDQQPIIDPLAYQSAISLRLLEQTAELEEAVAELEAALSVEHERWLGMRDAYDAEVRRCGTAERSLIRILGALDIGDGEDGWEDDAVQLIRRLRDLDDAALSVRREAQHDPAAGRFLVPGWEFRHLMDKLDAAPLPQHRP